MTIAAKKDVLESFISGFDPGFEKIYAKVRHPQKEKCRSFLIYIHNVLKVYSNYQFNEGVRFVHLHLPFSDELFKQTILEYSVIRYFNEGLENDQLYDDYTLKQSEIYMGKLKNVQVPEKASGAKKNRAYKNWESERKTVRGVLEFLNAPDFVGKSLLPKTIINLYNNDADILKVQSEEEWHTTTLVDLIVRSKRSYVVLNTDLSKLELVNKLSDENLLKNIQNIVLFDCEGRRLFRDFSKRNLDELVEYGIPIKHLVLFSFEKRSFRLRNTNNRFQQIYSNFYIQSRGLDFHQSFLFPKEEKDLLYSKEAINFPSIDWIGERNAIFENYLDLVKGINIDKLKSIPILNVYSFCFRKKIYEIIENAIFEGGDNFQVLDNETRDLIQNLEEDEKVQLKQIISLLLSHVVQCWEEIKKKIYYFGYNQPFGILVPHQILSNESIIKELKSFLPNTMFKLYTWNDIKKINIKEKLLFIFAYRDMGTPPFEIYPNIIENQIPDNVVVHLTFLKMFFFERFKCCTYKYYLSYNKLVSNKLRHKYLAWRNAESEIESLKTFRNEYLVDADDSDYGIAVQTESVRIEFTDSSHISVSPSKLLVAKKRGIKGYLIIRADELLEEKEPVELDVETLEELHADLNLFEITPEEENELKEIKAHYGLTGKDQNYSLWKIELIKRLIQHDNSSELLYETIKGVTQNDGKFIKYSYFRDYWLDKESELIIPRRTRHFRQICNYLGLPSTYCRLELKRRASLRSNSRQSNVQMNSLLAHMFSDGLFENDVAWESLDLIDFIDEHNLEERGIFQDNVHKELKVLVGLLKEEMKLKRVLKVELS